MKVSFKCIISLEKMVAVHTACLQMYRHKQYLIPEEQSPESQRKEASKPRGVKNSKKLFRRLKICIAIRESYLEIQTFTGNIRKEWHRYSIVLHET